MLVCHLCKNYNLTQTRQFLDLENQDPDAISPPEPASHRPFCTLGTAAGLLTLRGCRKEGQVETLTRRRRYLRRNPSLMTNTQGGHLPRGRQSTNGLLTYYNTCNIMLRMVLDFTASREFSGWNKFGVIWG